MTSHPTTEYSGELSTGVTSDAISTDETTHHSTEYSTDSMSSGVTTDAISSDMTSLPTTEYSTATMTTDVTTDALSTDNTIHTTTAVFSTNVAHSTGFTTPLNNKTDGTPTKFSTSPAETTFHQTSTLSTLNPTTKYSTQITTQTTTTTRKYCPQTRLFPHSNTRYVYGFRSPYICPSIDINVGQRRLGCFHIYAGGYLSENYNRFSYEPYSLSDARNYIIAPYWADLWYENPQVKYNIYEKYTIFGINQNALSKLKEFDTAIEKYANIKNFESVWALLVTWENVRHYSLVGRTREDYPGITFQMLLVTNGYSTYLLYLYKPCGMDMKIDVKALMGFYLGGNKRFMHKNSLKRNSLVNIDINEGNTGDSGVWLFDLRGRYQRTSKLSCFRWYADAERVPRINTCPCSAWQAWTDFRFFYDWWSGCYFSITSPPVKCCYSAWWLSYGVHQKYNYFFNYRRWLQDDERSFRDCCVENRMCYLYSGRRPRNYCWGYRNPFRAWMFGDPHIQTLDGLKYSFNGLGEYMLLRVLNKTTNITMLEIQARTSQAKNSNGTKINATIFSAFAVKDFITGASAQVELAPDEKTLVIYHKEIDKTSDFQKQSDYRLIDSDLFLIRNADSKDNQSVSLTFKSGVDVSVAVGIRMLAVTVSLPEGYKNTTITRGLMGAYNDDKGDDLTTPNGTVLPENSTERDIFYNFGQLWAINTSLFIYEKGFSTADFTDTSFIPLFIDKTSDIYKKALKICNEGDNACIYDYIATGDESIAKATESLDKQAGDDFQAARNTAPEISGNETVNVFINQTVTATLSVTDAESDSIIILKEQGGEYFNVNKTGNDVILSIYLMDSNPVNISIIANDTKNASSAEFIMSIVLCSGCSNHGNCTEDNPLNRTDNFVLKSCDCEDEYDGDHCEKDFDGCSVNPCPAGGNCTDLSPAEHKAQNISFQCTCPQGYNLNNVSRCIDINECVTNTPCEQTCTNTEGSFKCSCQSGYRLVNNTRCENIDECSLNTHNCKQLCNDTDGSYSCYCYEGYSLESNGSCTANISNSSPCSNNCQEADGCREVNGKHKCFCNSGYTLKNDSYCVDIDECQKNPCEGGCINLNGTFECSCPPGKNVSQSTQCIDCDEDHFGEKCQGDCDMCNDKATERCDNVNGCICNVGWKGNTCETDVNECQNVSVCSPAESCENKNGTYECNCKSGYTRKENTCVDIDECQELYNNSCPQDCVNYAGGYECKCQIGYKENGNTCKDIDECVNNVDGCEHTCVNTNGSFQCECFSGYKLDTDRKKCNKEKEIDGCLQLNCSDACDVNNGSASCQCGRFYKLDSTTSNTCIAIDKCSPNPCKNGTCQNDTDSFKCVCDIGYKLANDKLTCNPCNKYTYGYNCNLTCDCVKGSCDSKKGCLCDAGYTGAKCDTKDFCAENIGSCDNITSECVNGEQNYTCDCKDGYFKNESSRSCQNAVTTTTIPSTTTTMLNTSPEVTSSTTSVQTEEVNTTAKVTSLPTTGPTMVQTTVNISAEMTSPTTSVQTGEEFVYVVIMRINMVFANNIAGTLKTTLFNIYKKKVTGFVDVIINDVRSGSVVVNHTVQTTNDSREVLNKTLEEVRTSGLTIDNKTYNVLSISITSVDVNITTEMTSVPTTAAEFVYLVIMRINMIYVENLEGTLRITLFNIYKKKVTGFVDVIINDVSNGSVIVNHTVKTTNDSREVLTKTLEEVRTSGLTIDNKTYGVSSISINSVDVNTTTSVPTTVPTTEEDSSDLILGLGIGIPAVVILLVIILLCVWFKWKKKRTECLLNTSDLLQVDNTYIDSAPGWKKENIGINKDFEWNERTQQKSYFDYILESEDNYKIKRPNIQID